MRDRDKLGIHFSPLMSLFFFFHARNLAGSAAILPGDTQLPLSPRSYVAFKCKASVARPGRLTTGNQGPVEGLHLFFSLGSPPLRPRSPILTFQMQLLSLFIILRETFFFPILFISPNSPLHLRSPALFLLHSRRPSRRLHKVSYPRF